jgi:hypothetical protein
MEDKTYSNANAIAQIKLIYPSVMNNVIPQEARQQTAYDTWMAGGGTADFIQSYAPNSGHEFQIVVYRKDLNSSAGQPMRIRAWTGMPLFTGDIIEAAMKLYVTVDLLSGGRILIAPGLLVKLKGDGDAIFLNRQPKGLWTQFNEEKPFHFGTGAGSTMGVKG